MCKNIGLIIGEGGVNSLRMFNSKEEADKFAVEFAKKYIFDSDDMPEVLEDVADIQIEIMERELDWDVVILETEDKKVELRVMEDHDTILSDTLTKLIFKKCDFEELQKRAKELLKIGDGLGVASMTDNHLKINLKEVHDGEETEQTIEWYLVVHCNGDLSYACLEGASTYDDTMVVTESIELSDKKTVK